MGDAISAKLFTQNDLVDQLKNSGAKDEIARRMAAARAGADEHFGNGRFVRNAFERTLERQAVRLASSNCTDRASLQEIRMEDLAI